MRTASLFILLSMLGLGFLPASGSSQEGAFAFQIRGGQAVPLVGFRSGEGKWHRKVGQGPSFGMGFTLPGPGPLGAYLGFGQLRLSCDESVCSQGSNWISTGFDVALRSVVGKGRVRSWMQGGLHTHRIEGEVLKAGGDPKGITSAGGAGFEVGGGLLIAIGQRNSISPAVRYGRSEVTFPEQRAMGLRYLILDLGLVLGF